MGLLSRSLTFLSSSYKQQKVLPCLSWSSGGTAQGEKSKFFGSDLVLPGLQLLSRMPHRKRSCPGYLRELWSHATASCGHPKPWWSANPKDLRGVQLHPHELCSGLNLLDLFLGEKRPSHPKHFWWHGCSTLCHTGEFVTDSNSNFYCSKRSRQIGLSRASSTLWLLGTNSPKSP